MSHSSALPAEIMANASCKTHKVKYASYFGGKLTVAGKHGT
jgi:hypothetical protein